ncbi:prolyl-tRNA synthetase associated domain-containing protein [Anaerocolumna xylanovorans]|uniref:Ala-tRNA(Pro) deacylase n=1 Tax=Anaerocolumna xylanovorans DSM 12503 TaxID=1121345 RepID=A0A1M7YN77_9FIRM|nr:prolyl-tRNA synthetase associated domain-containing protein [Anaerocolumna xylanovorans]SHO54059.1 Ala-tRNA(Pro) deacylase [Anaerocolumna xylanovorans DSM 12503]
MSDFYIDPVMYTTRPSGEGRLQKEIRVYDLLEKLQIPFIRLDHDVTPTIEACHDIDKLLAINICKNLFLCNSQKTKFYLLLMPGDKKFKTAELGRQINSPRLSFAPAEYMEEHLDITPGSVSVLGLMNDRNNRVELLVDEDVLKEEYFGCHPCINTSSLKLKTSDLTDKILPFIHHTITAVKLQ